VAELGPAIAGIRRLLGGGLGHGFGISHQPLSHACQGGFPLPLDEDGQRSNTPQDHRAYPASAMCTLPQWAV
jgi:hypothetical protein